MESLSLTTPWCLAWNQPLALCPSAIPFSLETIQGFSRILPHFPLDSPSLLLLLSPEQVTLHWPSTQVGPLSLGTGIGHLQGQPVAEGRLIPGPSYGLQHWQRLRLALWQSLEQQWRHTSAAAAASRTHYCICFLTVAEVHHTVGQEAHIPKRPCQQTPKATRGSFGTLVENRSRGAVSIRCLSPHASLWMWRSAVAGPTRVGGETDGINTLAQIFSICSLLLNLGYQLNAGLSGFVVEAKRGVYEIGVGTLGLVSSLLIIHRKTFPEWKE